MAPPALAAVDDPWYVDPTVTWVDPAAAVDRPFRYGDLFHAPSADSDAQPLVSAGQRPTPWEAVLVIGPSCEIVSKADADSAIHVVRARDLTKQSKAQRAAVMAGWKSVNDEPRVAFASFAYLPPAGAAGPSNHDMYADFRQVRRVRFDDLVAAGRIAAMDHDARVAFIRREMYYKYRWIVPMADVRALEAARIRADPAFAGPKPNWAT